MLVTLEILHLHHSMSKAIKSSLSEIKGIHNQILELVQCPDQYQTCQEYYFNENSRIIDLASNIQFEKAEAKLIVSQAKSNLNIKSELLEKEKLLKLEKEQQKLVHAENKLQLAQLAEQFNGYNAYNNFELDKDIQKLESQSVKIDRYLEKLEVHHTPNTVDLTPSPYPKRFSPILYSLDVDLKDNTENIPYIANSLKAVSRNLTQDSFSENSNTLQNSNKPHSHSQPIDSFIVLLIEGKETVLSAVTSENITVAAALHQELETRHLPPTDLIPFDGKPSNWPEFIQTFKERAHLKKSFSNSMRMERLLSVLKGEGKNSIISIGANAFF